MVRFRCGLVALTTFLVFAPSASASFLSGWGYNAHLELGTGYKSTAQTVPVPTLIEHPLEVVTGGEWGAALVEGGHVLTWGGNESGQAGNGTRSAYKAKPSVVVGLENVVELAGNGEHLIARLANGEVRVWGSSKYGQECDGHEGKIPSPLPEHGKPWAALKPIPIEGVTSATEVAAGGADTLIRLADGSVIGCGEDSKEQLGDHSKANKTKPIRLPLSGVEQISIGGAAASGSHVLAVTATGVLALGLNDFGQLGDGTTTNRGTPVFVKGLTGVRSVSAGPDHNLAVLQDGQVVAWGDDEYGQLGNTAPSKCGPAKAQVACAITPQPVGLSGDTTVAGTHFSLVASSGRVFSFGQNRWATLGDGTKADKHSPTPVEGLEGVTSLAGGYFNGFAISANHVTPIISVISGKGFLTVNWVSTEGHEPWHVAIRPPSGEYSKTITLVPGTRSYTFSGLTSGEYTIRVNNKSFGVKTATGIPG